MGAGSGCGGWQAGGRQKVGGKGGRERQGGSAYGLGWGNSIRHGREEAGRGRVKGRHGQGR